MILLVLPDENGVFHMGLSWKDTDGAHIHWDWCLLFFGV